MLLAQQMLMKLQKVAIGIMYETILDLNKEDGLLKVRVAFPPGEAESIKQLGRSIKEEALSKGFAVSKGLLRPNSYSILELNSTPSSDGEEFQSKVKFALETLKKGKPSAFAGGRKKTERTLSLLGIEMPTDLPSNNEDSSSGLPENNPAPSEPSNLPEPNPAPSEPSDLPEPSDDTDDIFLEKLLQFFKAKELKAICKSFSISCSGKKEEMAKRIYSQEASDPEKLASLASLSKEELREFYLS